MSKKKKLGAFENLPQEIFDTITKHLPPVSRIYLKKGLAQVGINANPHPEQEKAMQVWNKIFKDDEWLNTVMNQTYTHVSPPIPVLIGYDILKLYKGSDERVYLLLTANDWGGDIQYAPDIRHSLRPHKYDKESHEVSIKGTKITIALERYNMEELELKEPQKLFRLTGKSKDKPKTAALYYNEDVPVQIGEDEIGGIRDNDRLLVQDLSTIMSKFRDGKPVMR